MSAQEKNMKWRCKVSCNDRRKQERKITAFMNEVKKKKNQREIGKFLNSKERIKEKSIKESK